MEEQDANDQARAGRGPAIRRERGTRGRRSPGEGRLGASGTGASRHLGRALHVETLVGRHQPDEPHCQRFFRWYNFDHRHAGIALLTPADVHHGRAVAVVAARAHVLMNAYAANPERFVRKAPAPPALPVASWINKPDEEREEPTR